MGNTIEKLQPGIIARMTVPGEIAAVGPNVPPSDSIGWLTFIERSIAIGANLSYEETARDYSRGNFSSTRASANADRKRFRPMQKFTIANFCMPAYRRFAQWASMRGVEGFPSIDDFAANMDEWLAVEWRTPGWDSVNPWDDARAAVLEINNGLNTRENYHGNRGRDWERAFGQLGREEDLAAKHGLAFESTVMAEDPSDTRNSSSRERDDA